MKVTRLDESREFDRDGKAPWRHSIRFFLEFAYGSSGLTGLVKLCKDEDGVHLGAIELTQQREKHTISANMSRDEVLELADGLKAAVEQADKLLTELKPAQPQSSQDTEPSGPVQAWE